MWYLAVCLLLATVETSTAFDHWKLGNKGIAYMRWGLAIFLVSFGVYYGVFVL